MKSIRDMSLRGVYGEHSKHNNLNYGGPECAALLPTEFKVMTLLVLVSFAERLMTHTAALPNLLLDVCVEGHNQVTAEQTAIPAEEEASRSELDRVAMRSS